MTDDKGAGEDIGLDKAMEKFVNEFAPIKALRGEFHDDGRGMAALFGFKRGYAAGRKAERERCLAIIERWRPMTKQTWVTVSNEIGGQDGK